jgi:hypothetical protein
MLRDLAGEASASTLANYDQMQPPHVVIIVQLLGTLVKNTREEVDVLKGMQQADV